MTSDFTKGSPMKQILLFSIPFLIGNLFQQFYSVADMFIVGRTLGQNAYAAVGATGSLVNLATGAVQSMTVGFSAVTARYFGARDEEGVRRSFATAIKLAGIIAIAFSLFCALFARPILQVMRTPADIIDGSYRYIVWIFAGLFATTLFNLLSNMIRALGDSRTPLYFLVVACVINIILDIVLIAVCGMGTEGAGIATVVAQLLSGACCIVYIIKKQPRLHITRRHFRSERALSSLLLRVGLPMAFLSIVISIGGIAIQFVTNGLGTAYVTAQTTGGKVEGFAIQPLMALGSALSVFVAQNYGAGKYDRVLQGNRKTMLTGWLFCLIAIAVMLPFGHSVVTLLAGDVTPDVMDNAYRYIVINTVSLFALVPIMMIKSLLQSLGRTFWCTVSGFTEIIGRAGLSVAVIMLMDPTIMQNPLDPQIGFTVMCFAPPLAWAFGSLTVMIDYIGLSRKFRRLAAGQKTEKEKLYE